MLSHDALACLTQQDPIPALLGDGAWQRIYGRTGRGPSATLLYERQSAPTELRTVSLGEGPLMVPGLGPIAIVDWSHDVALPMLAAVCARHPRLQPVRYRPGKRCTFKASGDRSYFAKLVADGRGKEIIENGRMLWAASREGRLGFGVARPAGWLPTLLMIVHHALPGLSVVEELSSHNGPLLASRLGAANATLAQSGLKPVACYDYGWQMARTAKYAGRLARHLPEAQGLLSDIQAHLSAIEPGPADKPIHGAPHAHQWLCDRDQLYLIDFDRFGLGDPELDVATFLAEWDFESESATEGVGHAYYDGFSDVAPLNSRLVGAYRLHKYVAKALRTMTAIRVDARQRAMAILEDALLRAQRLT
jgi:Phosphotransferase enzyme family